MYNRTSCICAGVKLPRIPEVVAQQHTVQGESCEESQRRSTAGHAGELYLHGRTVGGRSRRL